MTKVAAIQMCSTNDVDENLLTVSQLVTEATTNGSKLVVLPEMFALFGYDSSDKVRSKEAPGSGKIQTFPSSLALKHNIWIVGGTIPIEVAHDQRKFEASCIIFDNNGTQIARYNKKHLFDVNISETESYRESDTTVPGKDALVVDTPFGKLGLCVCYDIRFLSHIAELSALGAEIIAIPAAFTQKTGEAHWELLARCRAIDTFSYIIAACQGGIHENGRMTYGHSMIINPWGEVEDKIVSQGNGIAYSTIDLKKLYKLREQIPVLDSKTT